MTIITILLISLLILFFIYGLSNAFVLRGYLRLKENMRMLFIKYCTDYIIGANVNSSIADIVKYIRLVYSRSFSIEMERWLTDIASSKDKSSTYELAIVMGNLYGFDTPKIKTMLITCIEALRLSSTPSYVFDSFVALSDEISYHIARQKPWHIIS